MDQTVRVMTLNNMVQNPEKINVQCAGFSEIYW